MERSANSTAHRASLREDLRDDVTVRHWLAFYALLLLAASGALLWAIRQQGWSLRAWLDHPAETFAQTSPAVKLLGMGVYTSICSAFLPLPTGWLVAGVATRQAAVMGSLWATVAVVALIGGVGSTLANLNEYHLLTWMLRHRHVAKVRTTRTYLAAARWFNKRPFFLLLLFNIIPIPIDVVRMVATTARYPRRPFAVANFIGRVIRYGVIAFVTYYWNLGWIAVVALLALAAVLGTFRVGPALWRAVFRRRLTVQVAAAGERSASGSERQAV